MTLILAEATREWGNSEKKIPLSNTYLNIAGKMGTQDILVYVCLPTYTHSYKIMVFWWGGNGVEGNGGILYSPENEKELISSLILFGLQRVWWVGGVGAKPRNERDSRKEMGKDGGLGKEGEGCKTTGNQTVWNPSWVWKREFRGKTGKKRACQEVIGDGPLCFLRASSRQLRAVKSNTKMKGTSRSTGRM